MHHFFINTGADAPWEGHPVSGVIILKGRVNSMSPLKAFRDLIQFTSAYTWSDLCLDRFKGHGVEPTSFAHQGDFRA